MSFFFKNKTIIITLSLLVLVFTFFLFKNDGQTYNMVLTSDGFRPQVLNIKVGDTVLFTSEINAEYWPASDTHPTHDAYEEFDPLRALGSDEEWSFTFRKKGRWGVHDHLNSFFTAEIVVD